MKRVTIEDIAAKLNISFSTVARALNDHPAISEATKNAVKETATRLGYRQNKVAASLRSGRTHIIGVIVPNLQLSFFSAVVHGIERIMNENDYNILLYQSNEALVQEARGIDTFLQSRVDGIIASVTQETREMPHYAEIRKRGIPLLFFDRAIANLEVPSVVIDDFKGGYLATQHLVDQGYRRIVHINTEQNLAIFSAREEGYKAALIANGLAVDASLIVRGPLSLALGEATVDRFVAQQIPFDAIFAVEDFTAMGALQALKKHKIKVPSAVGVIGFANEAFGSLVTPTLSSVDQQTVRMGEESAKLFLKLLQQKGKVMPPEKIVLEPMLVPRASSGNF
ncbi:transcriptional regulator, LacI family [Chitinophaga costaii]|uniref:Transcriptional regulator, LacI family n=1 Tax=Chitinophaga costaii TaxID=1335309 RepID=A0A1C4C988_9BACT|nr:LacI family DNA-binding transcriptional regulator [Chitinophaga costaii]PUZ27182.1 LacI family transcriptional regulator [Chitinophaga costaii]SCC15697.1 transcriptional regulator, LacI family [Chitinophaga costaii]